MSLQCSIVGLPNVGKSTLFNALTKAKIDAANYPFCTIDPNVGIVQVPDTRLDQLASIVSPEKVIPTTVEFVDIASLVEGASKGEGLGNQFLSHIRQTDAILQVVRCFEDADIVHVDGKVDPVSDMMTIETELLLADITTLEKSVLRASKAARSGDKDKKRQCAFFEKVLAFANEGKWLKEYPISSEVEALDLKQLHLLTAKKMLYIANIKEGDQSTTHLEAVEAYAKKNQALVVPVCAEVEAQLTELDPEDAALFLEEMGMSEPGLNRVIHAAYGLLSLQTYFTAGPKEVRAWTVKCGASAPQAAGVIHTDFEKGFIRAEVIAFDDYVAHQGESGAKSAGRLRLEGRDYITQDGDVMHFRFNV